jgi:hypothetical protein
VENVAMPVDPLPPGFRLRADPRPAGPEPPRYRIERALSEGGFGLTYLAQDGWFSGTSVSDVVVIKEFAPEPLVRRNGSRIEVTSTQPQKLVERQELFEEHRYQFMREALVLQRLNHHRVVHVYDVWEENGTTYYAMELIAGACTLGDWSDRRSWEEIEAVGGGLLAGLEVLDRAGVSHFDLKPVNILMRNRSDPTLIDFGTAKLGTWNTRIAALSDEWSAPEVIAAARSGQPYKPTCGSWSDLYSWALIVVTLVLGREIAAHEIPAALAELNTRGVPLRWQQLLAQCLVADWQTRVAQIGTVRDVLARIHAPVVAPNMAAAPEPPWAATAFAAGTIKVGPGETCKTLQAALNVAAAGSTIALAPGSYDGTALTIDRDIRIVGLGNTELDTRIEVRGKDGIVVKQGARSVLENLLFAGVFTGHPRPETTLVTSWGEVMIRKCAFREAHHAATTNAEAWISDVSVDDCDFGLDGHGGRRAVVWRSRIHVRVGALLLDSQSTELSGLRILGTTAIRHPTTAADCEFSRVNVYRGRVSFNHCTIHGAMECRGRVEAEESQFEDRITLEGAAQLRLRHGCSVTSRSKHAITCREDSCADIDSTVTLQAAGTSGRAAVNIEDRAVVRWV